MTGSRSCWIAVAAFCKGVSSSPLPAGSSVALRFQEQSGIRRFKMAARATAFAALFGVSFVAVSHGQQDWRSAHVAAQFELGGSDADYRSCNGALFIFVGGSVEIGSPHFVEIAVDRMEAGGEGCAPAIVTAGGESITPRALSPRARYSMGFGRRFARDHILTTARIGFLQTAEPWLSVKVVGSLWHVTLGFEVGQIRAKWEFESHPAYNSKKWSSFSGIMIGARL